MKATYTMVLILLIAGFSSCKKWLDVKPKTQIESEVNFQDEQGFQDALTGVYLNMVSPALYGKELSFGFIEVLGKNYSQFTTSQAYVQDASYNYAFAATKARIDGIWKGGYNTIANINNLIDNLEKADKNKFSGTDFDVIRGEAYGLRAFNHFDLLRLFATSPASGGGQALAIPYRDRFVNSTVPRSTVTEVLARIIADLQIAATALKESDPIVAGTTVPSTTTGYLRDRQFKFNYYAVKALMARVYLYAGDQKNALLCAQEVINSAKFPTPALSQLIATNKIMSTEVIFNLYLNNLATLYDSNYSTTLSTGMYLSATEWSTVYEVNTIGSADVRYQYGTEVPSGSSNRYTVKFRPTGNTVAPNRLPLMRASELYYIAAECLASTDPVAAIDYLNTVRRSRNLTINLLPTLTSLQIQDEIFKEYRKDFITEGQLFYYYKRLNKARIEFTQTVGNDAVYVLPRPDDEIEFGTK